MYHLIKLCTFIGRDGAIKSSHAYFQWGEKEVEGNFDFWFSCGTCRENRRPGGGILLDLNFLNTFSLPSPGECENDDEASYQECDWPTHVNFFHDIAGECFRTSLIVAVRGKAEVLESLVEFDNLKTSSEIQWKQLNLIIKALIFTKNLRRIA